MSNNTQPDADHSAAHADILSAALSRLRPPSARKPDTDKGRSLPEVLQRAQSRAEAFTLLGALEHSILHIAQLCALEHPRLFAAADWSNPAQVLEDASAAVHGLHNVHSAALMAAALVAQENPALFKEPTHE